MACGKYSYSALKAKKAFRDANTQYAAQNWQEAAVKYEEVLANDPEFSSAHFYLANSYDNLYKPSRAGEAENDAYMQKAIEHYKKAAETDPTPATAKAGHAVSGCGLRPGQAEQPRRGRANRQADDRARPERADQLLRPLEDVRGRRPLRRGRGGPPQGQGSEAERPAGLHGPLGLLQPAGGVRKDDGRPASRRPTSTRTIRRATS